jgi:hypothetical protein
VMMPLFNLLAGKPTPEQVATIKKTLGDVAELSPIEKDVLAMRFQLISDMFAGWLNKKVLTPICELHGGVVDMPVVEFDINSLRKRLNEKPEAVVAPPQEEAVVEQPKESGVSTAIGIGLAGLVGSLFTAYANSTPSVRVGGLETEDFVADATETITQEATI